MLIYNPVWIFIVAIIGLLYGLHHIVWGLRATVDWWGAGWGFIVLTISAGMIVGIFGDIFNAFRRH